MKEVFLKYGALGVVLAADPIDVTEEAEAEKDLLNKCEAWAENGTQIVDIEGCGEVWWSSCCCSCRKLS